MGSGINSSKELWNEFLASALFPALSAPGAQALQASVISSLKWECLSPRNVGSLQNGKVIKSVVNCGVLATGKLLLRLHFYSRRASMKDVSLLSHFWNLLAFAS